MSSPVATPPVPPGPPIPEQEVSQASPADRGDADRSGPPGSFPFLEATAPLPRWRFTWRALLGCLLVIAASGGATAVAVLEQVHTVVQDLDITKPLKVDKHVLAADVYGQPETLLMIGDDARTPGKGLFKYYNASVPNLANEMLLVRIDPSKPWISMMSLPRELWVTITEPDGVTYTNRLNSAYTYGTTTLLKTIKQVTGLSVTHVIATTFGQFENAINTLGCVYDTIDERYYHNNADGGEQYQNVDLQPGYQCLNGGAAEEFVSYRHTDTSQVRDARDQSFLLAVKQQYGPELEGNLGRFEKIFGETVQTDPGLRSTTAILNLADLLASAAGLRVRQVPFESDPCTVTCPAGIDLTATPQQIQQSVHSFLFGRDVTPSRSVATIGQKVSHRKALARLPLTPTLASNVAAEKAAAANLQFTAEFPKVQDLAGSAIPIAAQCTEIVQACIRSYLIHAPDGDAYPIYVEVFSNGDLGQYYDVQGTTWTGAPLFHNPEQTLHVGTRTYDLFYDGSHLATVAWHQYGAVYWVHNTLTDAVGNGELLAIAEQTEPVSTVKKTPTHVILKAFSVPAQKAPAVTTPVVQSIGRVGGLVTVVLLPLGLLAVLINWRRVRNLRAQVLAAVGRAALIETHLATASAGYRQLMAQQPAVYGPYQPGDPRFAGAPPVPFERYKSRRPWVRIGLAIGLVAAAAAAYFVLESSAIGHDRKPAPEPLPTARVAVLNAGTAPGAAHRLAVELARRHVHVIGTGNLRSAPPAGYEVLYEPGKGQARQARLLAGVLKAEHPTVAPIGSATAQAAGSAPKLVIVIP